MLPLLSSWNLQMLKGSRQPPMEAAKPGILMVSRKQPKRVPQILKPSSHGNRKVDRPGALISLMTYLLSFLNMSSSYCPSFFHVISPARHAQPDANVVNTHDAACGRPLKPLNGRGIVAKRRCRFRCSHGNGESSCTISLHPPHTFLYYMYHMIAFTYIPIYKYIHDICINLLSSGVRCAHKFWGNPSLQVGEAARSKSKLTDLVRSAVVLARSATW